MTKSEAYELAKAFAAQEPGPAVVVYRQFGSRREFNAYPELSWNTVGAATYGPEGWQVYETISSHKDRGDEMTSTAEIIRDAKQRYLNGQMTLRELVNRCIVETLGLSKAELDIVWEQAERELPAPPPSNSWGIS
jgi:hypothetical protein